MSLDTPVPTNIPRFSLEETESQSADSYERIAIVLFRPFGLIRQDTHPAKAQFFKQDLHLLRRNYLFLRHPLLFLRKSR